MKEKIDKSTMIENSTWLKKLSDDLFNIYARSVCLKKGIIWWTLADPRFMTTCARKFHIKKIEHFNVFLLDFSSLPLNGTGQHNLLCCLEYLDKILKSDDATYFRACEYINDVLIHEPSKINRRSIKVIKEEKVNNIVTLDDLLDLNWVEEMSDDLRVIYEGAIFLLKGMVPYVNIGDINFMKKSARKFHIKKIIKFSYYLRSFDNQYVNSFKKKKLKFCLECLNKIIEKDDAVRFRACAYIDYFYYKTRSIMRDCISTR